MMSRRKLQAWQKKICDASTQVEGAIRHLSFKDALQTLSYVACLKLWAETFEKKSIQGKIPEMKKHFKFLSGWYLECVKRDIRKGGTEWRFGEKV